MSRKAIKIPAVMFLVGNALAEISKEGDELEKLSAAVVWGISVRCLIKHWPAPMVAKGIVALRCGDDVRNLVLKAMHNMSDAQIARMVRARIDYWRFLGIENVEDMPDEKTIWKFQNEVVQANVHKKLFAQFKQQICAQGFTASKGQSVDATTSGKRPERG